MKLKIITSLIVFSLFTFVLTDLIITYPTGITGRTKKTTLNGCGSCHGSSVSAGLNVAITGPDSIAAGTSSLFTLTTTSPTGVNGGLDVATRSGVLSVSQAGTPLLNSEITHTTAKPFSGGSVSFTFNYTAPNLNTIDTIFSTGLSSTGGTSGQWNWLQKRVKIYIATGIIQTNTLQPASFELNQNYPNPFNPITSIIYKLKKAENVQLNILDVSGKIVASPVNEFQQAGEYKLNFDGSKLSSGIYYYTIKAGDFRSTKSMVLLK